MKKIILLLFTSAFFLACEHTETNTTAMQANLNTKLFKAHSVSAAVDNNAQMIHLIGTSDHEDFTLHTQWRGPRTYEIGQNSVNYATYTDASGKVYTTATSGGSGEIELTIEDKDAQRLTGEFHLTFFNGSETIVVSGGLFYSVPYSISDVGIE